MNFLPAKLEDGMIKLPFGDAPIPDAMRSVLEGGNGKTRDVIAGVRPEHFEDADVEPDKEGLKFTAPVSVVESMGSELYAYFDIEHGAVQSSELNELAEDAGLSDLPTPRRRRRPAGRGPARRREQRPPRRRGQPGARHAVPPALRPQRGQEPRHPGGMTETTLPATGPA